MDVLATNDRLNHTLPRDRGLSSAATTYLHVSTVVKGRCFQDGRSHAEWCE